LSQEAGLADWKELEAAGLTNNISWDSATQSSYIFSNGNFYSLDSPQAIGVKDQYIKSNGLRGGMIFSLEADDAAATLFTAFDNGLK
jgi:chitinase